MKTIIYSEDPNFEPIEVDINKLHLNEYDGAHWGCRGDGVQFKGTKNKYALIHVDDTPLMLATYAHKKYRTGQSERWKEMEHIIVRDPQAVYWYSRWVIEGPWPEGEKTLLYGDGDGEFYHAMNYAEDIKGYWPELEAVLDDDDYNRYLDDLLMNQHALPIEGLVTALKRAENETLRAYISNLTEHMMITDVRKVATFLTQKGEQ
jgi:hypothetical protein